MSARGERGDRDHTCNGYRHHQRWSPHRSLSPFERKHGGKGPFAREAETGGEQGEWTWVSYGRRKATGQDRLGQDGFRQGNGYDGYFLSGSEDGFRGGRGYYDRSIGGYRRGEGFGYRDRPVSRARSVYSTRRGRSASRQAQDKNKMMSQYRPATEILKGKQSNLPAKGATDGSLGPTQVYYITNFPDQISFVELKQGLEVCGILEDLFVSQNRNYQGLRFGFVKFLKVRDVEKLRKALNNVFFWNIRLYANVAKFDRFVSKSGRSEGEKREGEGEKISEEKSRKRVACDVVVVGSSRIKELELVKQEAIRQEREREGEPEVLVGQVVCGEKKEVREFEEVTVEKQGWNYLSLTEGVDWATRCSVAKIKYGRSVFDTQQALIDSGLDTLQLIVSPYFGRTKICI